MTRVDTIPLLLRPLFWLYGWCFALLLYGWTKFIRLTCTISFSGPEREGPEHRPNLHDTAEDGVWQRRQPQKQPRTKPCLASSPSTQRQYIYCIWHESLAPFFCVFTDMRNQAWMNHPAWYMKPIHTLLRLNGLKHLCLGSSGNSGKEALGAVIAFLKQGYSTTLASDGPSGPAYQLKPGVLLMSSETGIPVIAVRFVCEPLKRLGGWDRKIVPLPFSNIQVECSPPVLVHPDKMQAAQQEIENWLNFLG